MQSRYAVPGIRDNMRFFVRLCYVISLVIAFASSLIIIENIFYGVVRNINFFQYFIYLVSALLILSTIFIQYRRYEVLIASSSIFVLLELWGVIALWQVHGEWIFIKNGVPGPFLTGLIFQILVAVPFVVNIFGARQKLTQKI